MSKSNPLVETQSRIKVSCSTPTTSKLKKSGPLFNKTPEIRPTAPTGSAKSNMNKPYERRNFHSNENLSKDLTPYSRTLSHPARAKGYSGSLFQERHSIGSPLRSTPTRTAAVRNSEVLVKINTPEIYTAVRFETPRKNTVEQLGPGVEKSNLVVAVRVRPRSLKEEMEDTRQMLIIKDNEVNVQTEFGQTHTFTYDHCFSTPSSSSLKQGGDQSKVYENLAKPLLNKAFEGYNTCLFAYGQTGSGKSYSIMGNIGNERELHETAGIVPRFCHDLFRKLDVIKKKNAESVRVQISYFEIYKEKIQDLLSPAKASLRVREHPHNGPYVVDLSHHAVNSFEEVQRWLLVGNRQRATAATSSNERSSRSHAIFTITLAQSHVEKVDGQSHEIHMQSRINFIDLAGSERVASVNSIGERREEGLTINQSLLTLGRVITALADQSKFVPYRESVLTWLLKESLGGDSKTVMLATTSPHSGHIEETLSTLRYACQARSIINTARIGEDPNARVIRHLREQIKLLEQRSKDNGDLRVSVEAVVSGSHVHDNEESNNQKVDQLESELRMLRNHLEDVQHRKDLSWEEKILEAEKKRQQAEQVLSNYGLSTHKDPDQPCLVNVSQDPSLSGTLFFPLRAGSNWIGATACSVDPPAIQLEGFMIEEKHCCIDNVNGALTLSAPAETYVNGQLVTGPVLLSHGDRVIVGGSHYFHLHHPKSSPNSLKNVPDYMTAYEELRKSQEERLQAAVRQAQEQTRTQLLSEMEELRHEAALEMSLQKHSYEDEIASLNRVLEERKMESELDSPPPPSMVPSKSVMWEDIELLLQDTRRQLELPAKMPTESVFSIQSMINEANAICRRFHAPYTFSRRDALEDGLESAICVQDQNQHLYLKWSVDTLREKLKILRHEAEDGQAFPYDQLFDGADVWQVEDDSLTLIAPSIRDKLDKLQKRHEYSFSNTLDDSRFSIDSSRRSSLLPRSPPCDSSSLTADSCRSVLAKSVVSVNGDIFTAVSRMCAVLEGVLSRPERTSGFSVALTVHGHSVMAMLPCLVEQCVYKREMSPALRQGWKESALALCHKLQNAVEYIMQGIHLDSKGLLSEWIQRSMDATSSIQSLLCELASVFYTQLPELIDVPASAAIKGFATAQTKIHQSIVDLTDSVRMKMAQLPEEDSIDSADTSNPSSNWLIKACHDSVTQVQILLERHTPEDEDRSSLDESDLSSLHWKFHQRIDILLRMGSAADSLYDHLNAGDMAQVKFSAAALESQARTYAQLISQGSPEPEEQVSIADISFAVSMVLKIVAERKRMMVLRRGRDISYSPLPARLLASSRKRHMPYFSDCSAEESDGASSESIGSSAGEEDGDQDFNSDVSISPTVIQRALRFQTPSKSSLKMTDALTKFSQVKNVRFNVSLDTTSSSPQSPKSPPHSK